MNPRTDYTSTRKPGEGYYTLHSNSQDEADVEPVWEFETPEYKAPEEDEAEKVSVL